MTLKLGETILPIAQLGADFLILKEPAPPQQESQGIIRLTVDGICEEIPVQLPMGIEATSRRVVIAEIEAPALSAR